MNTALILAGGIGQRVGKDIPKQFLEVNGTPIIVYTLSVFQNHNDIDQIAVVCVKGWEDEIRKYIDVYKLNKIVRIIPGGSTSMESIMNGVFGISDIVSPEDNIIIHDSVRPLIDKHTVSDCISVCNEHGNGCASIPMQETIVKTEDRISGNINIDRSNIMRVQTPQAYRYDLLKKLYEEAKRQGITDSVYTNTLMLELGYTIFFSKGSPLNLKITTADDIDLFDVILKYLASKTEN